MSAVPEAAGRETFRDDTSESSDDAALSDPDTDEVESIHDEDVFEAADHVAEDVFRDAQEDIGVESPTAESPTADYHEAEVQAYFARSRPQGEDQPSQPETTAEPALTAETTDNAALPSIEAVTVDESELQQEPSASEADASSSQQAGEEGTARQPDLPEIQEVLEDAAAPSESQPQSDISKSESETSAQTREEEGPASSTAQTRLADIPEQSVSPPTEAEPVLEQVQPATQPASEAAAAESELEEATATLESETAAGSEAKEEAESSSRTAEQTAATINSSKGLPRLPSLPARRSQAPARPRAEQATAEAEGTTTSEPSPAPATDPPPTVPVASSSEPVPISTPAVPVASSSEEPVPISAPPQVAESSANVTDKPAQPTDNPVPASPPTAAANNGRTGATGASTGNGNGSPSPAVAPGAASSSGGGALGSGEAPAKPSATRGPALPSRASGSSSGPALPARPSARASGSSSGPALPARASGSSSGPALPARASGSSSGPALPARPAAGTPPSSSGAQPSGSANPSIPPRQPAANPTPPAATPPQQPASNGSSGTVAVAGEEEVDEHNALREKVQGFRELLVRLTLRLGQSTRGTIVQQVNYRLDLAERLRLPGGAASTAARKRFGFEAACRTAEQQEQANPDEPLPFACTVMVIGMSGVGKSATINSVLDQVEAAPTNAFGLGTTSIKQVTGTVAGVKIKFIDTPGLQPSAGNIGSNQRKLVKMQSAFKKHKPDLVVYMDRADVLRTDGADVPLLKAITETFGPSLWFNTIVALTHAAAAPPDGNNGPLTYDTYTRGRTQLLQQNIRQATGDMRLLNPVALVENHPACRKNERGQAVLPNQMVWKPHFLLLLLSSKLLSDTDGLLKVQQGSDAQEAQRRAMRMLLQGRKMPPIPYLLANFIQKKSPRKTPYPEEQALAHPCEVKHMSEEDHKAEVRKRRMYKEQRRQQAKYEQTSESPEETGELALQPTFDPDNNGYRFRYSEPRSETALGRPVLQSTIIDHDDGLHGVMVDHAMVLRKPKTYLGGAPAYAMAQVLKNKDEFNLISEGEVSYNHTDKLVSTATLDVQTIHTDALFTGKLETRFNNLPKNSYKTLKAKAERRKEENMPDTEFKKERSKERSKRNMTALGFIVSRLKDEGGLPTQGPIVYGYKAEDRLRVSENLKLSVATATMMNKPDGKGMPKEQGWAHSLEAQGRTGEYNKIGVKGDITNERFRGKSTYVINAGMNMPVGNNEETHVASNFQLTPDRTGRISLVVKSTDKPQLGFTLLFPIFGMLANKLIGK